MSATYPKFKQACLSVANAGVSAFDLSTATVKAILLNSSYTYSSAHQFLSDVSANGVGTDQTCTVTSTANGTLKVTFPNWTGIASATIKAVALYISTGTPSTSALIAVFDGTFVVTAAANATNGATSVTVDPLPYALANGSTITLNSAILTLTSAAAQGARTLAVNGTWGGTGNITAGATGTGIISGCNLPFVVSSSPITFTVTPDGTNGFFTI